MESLGAAWARSVAEAQRAMERLLALQRVCDRHLSALEDQERDVAIPEPARTLASVRADALRAAVNVDLDTAALILSDAGEVVLPRAGVFVDMPE